jgi:hypothetical protein
VRIFVAFFDTLLLVRALATAAAFAIHNNRLGYMHKNTKKRNSPTGGRGLEVERIDK